ncbi:MAG TPA: cyclic nucleotide-binding domain-containing protein [Gaiellaceae bacterium]
MRVESSVMSVTWIPSEAISGMPKMPFELGIAHYDDPPPDRLVDLDAMHENDMFREANELKAFIEVEDGEIVGQGYTGRGRIGVTRIKLGPRELAFAAVQYPLLQAEPELGDGWVKFVQSAGGHMGLPAPRRVSGKPFFRIKSASAWTTLELILYADGTSKHRLAGASPFPRHWVYDKDGNLVEKSGTIDFEKWYRESHGPNTPWGDEDSPALVTVVESELERQLSASIMRSDAKLDRRDLKEGETLVEQGAEGNELYLLLDGVLDVIVDGEPLAEVGPGALLGERALLEGGRRTATLRAKTQARVAVVPAEAIEQSALPELAASHRREQS